MPEHFLHFFLFLFIAGSLYLVRPNHYTFVRYSPNLAIVVL